MVMLSKYPKVAEYDLSSVDTILCGAAPLSAKVEQSVKEKLKLSHIHQGRVNRLFGPLPTCTLWFLGMQYCSTMCQLSQFVVSSVF